MQIATVSSTMTFEHLLHATISTSNALPFQRTKKSMDDLVKHDLLHKVQWANTDATMEVIIPTSKLNIGDLEKITHKINTVGGKLANGPRVFDKSTGGWHLDKYN